MINHFFPCRKANQAIVFQPQFGKFYYDNKSSEMGRTSGSAAGGKIAGKCLMWPKRQQHQRLAVKSKTKSQRSTEAVASVSTMSEIQFQFDSYPISGQISENVFIFMPLSNGFGQLCGRVCVLCSVSFERVNNLSRALCWLG